MCVCVCVLFFIDFCGKCVRPAQADPYLGIDWIILAVGGGWSICDLVCVSMCVCLCVCVYVCDNSSPHPAGILRCPPSLLPSLHPESLLHCNSPHAKVSTASPYRLLFFIWSWEMRFLASQRSRRVRMAALLCISSGVFMRVDTARPYLCPFAIRVTVNGHSFLFHNWLSEGDIHFNGVWLHVI